MPILETGSLPFPLSFFKTCFGWMFRTTEPLHKASCGTPGSHQSKKELLVVLLTFEVTTLGCGEFSAGRHRAARSPAALNCMLSAARNAWRQALGALRRSREWQVGWGMLHPVGWGMLRAWVLKLFC